MFCFSKSVVVIVCGMWFGMNASLYCQRSENTRLWPWDVCGPFNIFINGLCSLGCVVPVVWKTFLFLPSVNSFIVWLRLFFDAHNAFYLKASSENKKKLDWCDILMCTTNDLSTSCSLSHCSFTDFALSGTMYWISLMALGTLGRCACLSWDVWLCHGWLCSSVLFEESSHQARWVENTFAKLTGSILMNAKILVLNDPLQVIVV